MIDTEYADNVLKGKGTVILTAKDEEGNPYSGMCKGTFTITNPPKYDPNIYNEFLARKEQLAKEREERKKDRKKNVQDCLNSVVKEVLSEFQKSGIEAN